MQARILAIACLALAPACQAAAISGRIVVTAPLAKKRISVPVYGTRGPAPEPVGSSLASECERAVVFLTGPGLPAAKPIQESVWQRNQRFVPELLIVPVGSVVAFPNGDPFFHNVFSLSGAKQFDLGYYPQGHSQPVRFERAGVVQIYCHIHANMTAAIIVAPSAAIARPGADGLYRIPNVPDGTYQVVLWHRSAGYVRKTVTVISGDETVDFVIPQ